MKVVVASTNPTKIEAATLGFSKMFPDTEIEVSGVSASSDVSDQPMTEEETLQGAKNRAENLSMEVPDADYWVGMEGGIREEAGSFFTVNWIVIKSKDGKVSKGNTGSYMLPPKITTMMKEGTELAQADGEFFGRENTGKTIGTVGILTGEVLNRTTYYEDAVVLALIPFKNQEYYTPTLT